MTKNAKRVLLAALIAIVIVSVTVLAVACDTTYTVTVVNDSNRGSVTLNPQKSAYKSGESVTVTVTPAVGYDVDEVEVNGEEVELDNDGSFTLVVKSNIKIEVTYKVATEHTVTLNVGAHGSAYLYPESENNVYSHGEQIAVVVESELGYGATVKVNGDVVMAEDEGIYLLTVNTNLTVDVSFSIVDMEQSVLDSLTGNLQFSGFSYYNEYDMSTGDEYQSTSYITRIFDDSKQMVWMYEESEYGTVYSNYLCGNIDGDYSMIYHTTDGKVQTVESGESFYKFYNQFIYLELSDFVFVSEGVWMIADENLASTVAAAITGWDEPIARFYLYEQEGKITEIAIITYWIRLDFEDDSELVYQSTYWFGVSEGSIPDEWVADYQVAAEHAELQAALSAASSATSYKINCVDKTYGFDDVEYNQYVDVANSRTYNDYVGEEATVTGYLMYNDAVWSYNYIDGKACLVSSYEKEFAAYIPLFDFNVALLEPLGDGVFRLRSVDRIDSGIASYLGTFFGVGVDEQSLYYYAFDIQITLKDGALYQVELAYNYMGVLVGGVTLTFSEFNTATIPVDLEIAESLTYNFDESMVGKWIDEDGTRTIEIKDDGTFTLDGVQAFVYYISELTETIEFLVNGEKHVLKLETNYVVLDPYTDNAVYFSRADGLAKMYGTYEGSSDSHTYKLVISAEGIVFTIDGVDHIIEDYEFDAPGSYIVFSIDDVEWTVMDMGQYGQSGRLYAYSGDDSVYLQIK